MTSALLLLPVAIPLWLISCHRSLSIHRRVCQLHVGSQHRAECGSLCEGANCLQPSTFHVWPLPLLPLRAGLLSYLWVSEPFSLFACQNSVHLPLASLCVSLELCKSRNSFLLPSSLSARCTSLLCMLIMFPCMPDVLRSHDLGTLPAAIPRPMSEHIWYSVDASQMKEKNEEYRIGSVHPTILCHWGCLCMMGHLSATSAPFLYHASVAQTLRGEDALPLLSQSSDGSCYCTCSTTSLLAIPY